MFCGTAKSANTEAAVLENFLNLPENFAFLLWLLQVRNSFKLPRNSPKNSNKTVMKKNKKMENEIKKHTHTHTHTKTTKGAQAHNSNKAMVTKRSKQKFDMETPSFPPSPLYLAFL